MGNRAPCFAPLRGELPQKRVHAAFRAFAFAGVYIVLCSLYIWLSDMIAEQIAGSMAELRRIQSVKGTLFVIASGALFFVLVWFSLRRIVEDDRRLREEQQAFLAAERRAIAGVFASSTAHDMNNILMTLYADLEELKARGDLTPSTRESMGNLSTAVDDLSRLANRLMDCGKEGISGEFDQFDLSAFVRETVEFTRRHKKVRRCQVEISAPDTLPGYGNPNMIQQMLINLILNAADATHNNGRIRVLVHQTNGRNSIEVHDSGEGIPEEQRGQVFEPFFTTKKEGCGLGLLSVKVCADMHHGTVSIAQSDLGGACFRISLPAPAA